MVASQRAETLCVPPGAQIQRLDGFKHQLQRRTPLAVKLHGDLADVVTYRQGAIGIETRSADIVQLGQYGVVKPCGLLQ